ncbi:hypothetical protein M8C21_019912 [Ambrosia artemisiifolia]|uniref:Gnk2-homologous domain-containing protein n=1 Tax=Ambrosia artemisiifolia TaxID=4212 RepID=A0AAD5D7X0_AMBAR|nr:hypothetical protein M8C21_019912 [Ambrosia artemisiifolia]
MSILIGKLLLRLSFIFMLSTKTTSFTYYYCEKDGNFTTNSTYRTNLYTALSTLPTTNTGLGFFNQSIGQGSDRVYTSALCRGDINPDACDSCLNNSLVNLPEMCPNQKGAIGYHDACLLYYSNKSIFGNTSGGGVILYNAQNASDRDRFTVAPGPLLNKLIVEAAGGGLLRKFSSSNTTEPGSNITIYGLVQCIPYLTGPQCSDCLKNALDVFVSQYSWSIGGRLLQPKCNFRYEIYPFFNSSTPVTSPPPPPPPQGKTSNSTVIIVVVVVTICVGVVTASIYIFLRSRKKKKQMLHTNSVDNEMLDDSIVESLQYNFNLVKAATNDFSIENKLGQGGFGAVHKGKLGDDQEVAVKRLASDSGQGDIEFKNEVFGYMAPEYAMHGQFSVKSDVFSYGVLVLEMITGQKNQCFKNGESIEDLLSFAWESWQNGTVTKMIDPILSIGSGSLHEIIRSIHIGLLCVQENVAERPTMDSVLRMLNSFSVTLRVPSEPAFFVHGNTSSKMTHLTEYGSSTGSHGLEKSKIAKSSQISIVGVSISETIPR